jgi:hypothetical protein
MPQTALQWCLEEVRKSFTRLILEFSVLYVKPNFCKGERRICEQLQLFGAVTDNFCNPARSSSAWDTRYVVGGRRAST